MNTEFPVKPITSSDQIYKQAGAYMDAHCAAFNGWELPVAKTEFDQQCIDRGQWDGQKARERALGSNQ